MSRAHDWKMKSHAKLSILRLSHKKGQLAKDPRKFLFGKKVVFSFIKSLPTLYIPLLTTNYKECFFREKNLENTLDS